MLFTAAAYDFRPYGDWQIGKKLKKIDFFIDLAEPFHAEVHFIQQFSAAWKRRGVLCRILPLSQKGDFEYLRKSIKDPPDFTCSFATKFTHSEKNTTQQLGIPHFYYFVDSAIYADHLLDCPNVILSCIDSLELNYLKKCKNELNLIYLPQATDEPIEQDNSIEKPYEVLFIGNCIDYETFQKEGRELFSSAEFELIERSVHEVLYEPSLPFFQVIVDQLEHETKEQPRKLHWLWRFCESILRGIDRISLIRSIRSAKVHLFGEGFKNKKDWHYYLSNQPNVVIHPPVTYVEGLRLIAQSRIVLNSTPSFKMGAHERLFTGMARGALLVTNDNPWVHQAFKPNEELLPYHYPELHLLDERISYYLHHPKALREATERGRKKALQFHTWDCRVESCLQQLPPILERVRCGKN